MTNEEILELIAENLPSGETGAITAAKLREVLNNILEVLPNTEDGTGLKLKDILAQGNVTDGNTIVVSEGDYIRSGDDSALILYNAGGSNPDTLFLGKSDGATALLAVNMSLDGKYGELVYRKYGTETQSIIQVRKSDDDVYTLFLSAADEENSKNSNAEFTPERITSTVTDSVNTSVIEQEAGALVLKAQSMKIRTETGLSLIAFNEGPEAYQGEQISVLSTNDITGNNSDILVDNILVRIGSDVVDGDDAGIMNGKSGVSFSGPAVNIYASDNPDLPGASEGLTLGNGAVNMGAFQVEDELTTNASSVSATLTNLALQTFSNDGTVFKHSDVIHTPENINSKVTVDAELVYSTIEQTINTVSTEIKTAGTPAEILTSINTGSAISYVSQTPVSYTIQAGMIELSGHVTGVSDNNVTNNVTFLIPPTKEVIYVTFTGTTSTFTLPVIADNTNVRIVIINAGSGTITLNSNTGASDIWTAGVTSAVLPSQQERQWNCIIIH